MIKRLRQFNPDIDDHIAYVNRAGGAITAGPEADIDCFVYHSKKHGFYLIRNIMQIRRGRVWMTDAREDDTSDCTGETRRCLTTLRPLNRPEVIRLILETYLPEQEGVRAAVMKALAGNGLI